MDQNNQPKTEKGAVVSREGEIVKKPDAGKPVEERTKYEKGKVQER
jgi:hypothetical protein